MDGAIKEGGAAMEPRDQLAMAGQKARFKSVDAAQAFSSAANSVSQKFVQTVPLSVNAKTLPVLESFEVRQNSNNLSIVDRDGSVYNGLVQVDSSALQNNGTVVARPVQFGGGMTDKSEPMQSQATFNFRVEGQNRTLKQNIVFAGNLVPLPGTNAVTQSSLIYNARITGTATVDATNQIKIDAVPASP
jgi:hypothetical protein